MVDLYQSQCTIVKIVLPRHLLKLLAALALFIILLPAQLSAQTNTLDRLGLSAATPAAGAYSLRLLSDSYTGPLARINRLGVYYDVYPDPTTKRFSLNSRISAAYNSATAAQTGVTTDIFANTQGSQSATVAIWYDQSGNGNNAIQTNASLQPQVVTAGVVNTLNSLPTITFSGAQWLVVTTTAFNGDLSGSIVYSATGSNSSANSPQAWYVMNGILGSEQPNAVNDFGYGIFNGKFTAGNGLNDNSVATTTNVNDATTRITSWARSNSGGTVALFNMMQTNSSATLNAGSRTSVSSVAIGSIATFGGGQFYGSLSEMILTPSVYTGAARKTIEGNQTTYFSVVLPSSATLSTLSSLSLSAGTLSPAFASGTPSYTASVSGATTSITVTPTTTTAVDPTVEVRVNGGAFANVNSGTASASLALNPGDNTVDIKVTAANGINSQIYTVTVSRPMAQTITFNPLAQPVYGDADFSPGASASSGSTVSYSSSDTNVATIVNGKIHIVSAGTTIITASQPGGGAYLPAPDATQSLTIAKRPIILGPIDMTKVYGSADPTLPFNFFSGSVLPGEQMIGELGRLAGENVGTYAITAGTKHVVRTSPFADLTGNYDITVTPANLTITQNPVNTITFNALTKIYGDADFSPGATASSGLTVTYSSDNTNVATIIGSTIHIVAAGTANITVSQSGDSNYAAATNVTRVLTVSKRAITIQPAAASKIYGDADPGGYPYYYRVGSLVTGDGMTGSFVREPGEIPGTYALSIGTKYPVNATTGVDQSGNYDISFLPEYLTINKRAITLAPVPATKVYGNADPGFPYQFAVGSLAPGEGMTGTFGRAPGENVGTYALTLGTKRPVNATTGVFTDQYYTISFISNNLTITQNPNNTITFNDVAKNYGEADFSPATASSSVAVIYSSDNTSVATIVGNNIHLVGIGTANITASNAGDSNWGPATNVIQSLTVNKGTAIVTATGNTKVYGNANPVFTYTTTGVVNGDAPTGALAATLPSGNASIGDYAINQGTLSYGSKYNVTYIGANLTITKRPITVLPIGKTKVYGDADPFLNQFQITAGSLAPGDATGDQFGRAAGESVGTYLMNLGNKKFYTNSVVDGTFNYDVTVQPAYVSITAKPLTVTADAQTKVAGAPDPAFTYTSDGLINDDILSGTLTRDAGESPGTYAITQGTLANGNYDIDFTPDVLTITPQSDNADLSGITLNAATLSPVFDKDNLNYTASVSAATASIDITATIADVTATITYNSQTHASGSPINVALNPGDNSIPLLITAENGATKTYTLTVNRLIPPVLDYGSAAVFTINQAISPITPTAANVAAFGYSSDFTPIGNITGGKDIALDNNGNVYVVDKNGAIKKYGIDGSDLGTIDMGGLNSKAIALDTAGNLYVVASSRIIKVAAGTGQTTTLILGSITFEDIVVDKNGNIYVADIDNNLVKKMPAGGGPLVVVGSGFSLPVSVAVDAAGDVYVADFGNSKIKKIRMSTDGGTEDVMDNIKSLGLTVDKANNLFFADFTTKNIYEIPANGSRALIVASNIEQAWGISADNEGKLYVADDESTTALAIAPTGGYFIDKLLPAGLSFDQSTGIISGTPTEAIPATTYNITAWNGTEKTTTSLSITLTIPVPPTLAYTPTLNLAIGKPASVTPTGSGTEPYGYNKNIYTNLVSGHDRPADIAKDTQGNTFIIDENVDAVMEYPVNGGAAIARGSGYSNPQGVALDADGNLYVTCYNAAGTVAQLIKIAAGSNVTTVLATGFHAIGAVAVDKNGIAYVNDNNVVSTGGQQRGFVMKVPAGGGTPVKFSTLLLDYLADIAVTSTGDVYIVNGFDEDISLSRLTPTNRTTLPGGSTVLAVAKDAADNIYYSILTNPGIVINEIPASNNWFTNGHTGGIFEVFSNPEGPLSNFTINWQGILQALSYQQDDTRVYKPTGGYFINKPLPAGLFFDQSSGAINGTPTVIAAAQNYKITTWNGDGSTEATVNLAVVPASNNADLSALSLSAGTLTPVFNKDTLNYTAQVAANISAITLSPSAADTTAIITVNGNTVASGQASNNISLTPGDNTITVDVLAEDGLSAKTYTVTVNRGLSANNNLRLTLNPTEELIKYNGGPANANYKVSVSPSTSYVQLFAKPQDAGTSVTVNGLTVYPGDTPDPVYLDNDTTYIDVTAIAANGTPRTYSVMVTKTGSYNAKALFKTDSRAPLAKAVTGPAALNYATVVSNATTTISIYPISENPGAVVKVAGKIIADGTSTAALPLNATGPTVIPITVTSENGATTISYSITVTKTVSDNANANFALNSNSILVPVAGPEGKNYFASVAASATSVTVRPKTDDPNAAVTINGIAVANNTASSAITLTGDTTLITMSVLAEDGVTTNTYSIAVAKNGSNNSLAKITLSNKAALLPYFGSADKNYIALLSPGLTSVGIIATPQDINAKVYINGVLSPAKTPVPVTLVPDDATLVDVEIRAEDNTTVTTYSILLAPLGSGNYNATFKLSPKATLVKVPNDDCGCGGAEATYTTSVNAATQFINVTTLAKDTAATIYVNGIETANGIPSAPVTLNDDSTTTIIIDVVSESGLPKTYYIIVSKTGSNYAGASFALLPASQLIQTRTGTANVNYTTTVSAAQTSVKIIPKAADPTATVTINGNPVATGDTATVALNSGVTMVSALVTAKDGITTKTFSFAISKNGSNNALAKLKINSGTLLTKTTGSANYNYITSVPVAATEIGITPLLEDANATVTINGVAVTAGAQSLQTLAADTSVFNIQVTAQDGVTIKIYALNVVKNGSNVATATFALNTSSKVDKASSGPAQINFSTSVSPLTTALVVTPKLTDAHATVTINGVPATDGLPSDPVSLNASGTTLISMLVTAEDGVSTKSYSILVAKNGSNNADLALSLSPKSALTKVGAAGNYQASVDAGLSSIKVKTKAAEAGTTITINGAPASTAIAGTPVTLTGDTTVVNITSVAEDGVSTKVYTISLIKSASLRTFATVPDNKNDVIATTSTKLLTPITNVSSATKGVTIYPNPFVNELKIDLKGYNAKEVHITITTLLARELFNQTLPVVDNKVELNVSSLKQGIYIINMLVNGERKGYRIVKN